MPGRTQTETRQQKRARLAQEVAQKQAVARQKVVAREKLFPLLHAHSSTLKHAMNTVDIFKSVIQTKQVQHWKGKTVNELGLAQLLAEDDKAKDRELNAGIVELLDDIDIYDALQILDGMSHAIEGYLQRQAWEKQFSELTVDDLINPTV